jgi:3',5'-cyclic AMP phosphodiesterase CpdA
MRRHSIIQVSDMHLSESRAYNQRNWEAALALVNSAAPDLTIFTGDLVLDDPDVEADHAYARAQIGRVKGAWLALPGNHDIGDSKPEPYMDQPVSDTRLALYRRHFGPDRWLYRLGEWRIIGINSLILDSGLADEEKQYDWISEVTCDDKASPTAIFLHKPLFLESFDENILSHWCVTPHGRKRLWSLLKEMNVRLIACGHTHHFRTMTIDGIAFVWAPTTGHIDFDDPIAFTGLRSAGVVRYFFSPNGVEFGLVIPDGLTTWNAAHLIRESGSMRNAPLFGTSYSLEARQNAV